ncbi:MAG TPA: hypothetical protein VFO37_04810 [Chitinophagaceae bacterium]|nr:hypothetical protein [Chitinophagaceae bacterium]
MAEADLYKLFLQKKIPYAKPLYSINFKKDEEVLDWFRETDQALNGYYRPLFLEQKQNLAFFLGSGINPNFSSPYLATFAATSDFWSQPQKIFVNEAYRVIMDQVSLVTSHELIPDVLPNTDDYADKVACNVVKEWLESMNYDLGMEQWRFVCEMQKKVFGESFIVVVWNPEKGDLHPYAKQEVDEEADFIDQDERSVESLGGDSLKIRKSLRIGDIEFLNPYPWEVQFDPKMRYEDSLWFYWKEAKDVDYLKKKYPKYDWDAPKNSAQKTNQDTYFDAYTGADKDDPNRRTIFYLYHRSMEFMPEGRYIVCSRENILVNQSLSMPTIINNSELPIVRFRDLRMGIGTRSIPILMRNEKNLIEAYNDITNQWFNNAQMESPKLFAHVSSGVDMKRIPDGNVGVEWDGHIKPTIETVASSTPNIQNLREALRRNIDEMGLQTPMVRGDTPNAQLDSFVALQHFEDLRNQLASPDIKSHIACMELWFKLMITVARDKYRKEDGRLMKILGKHHSYQLKFFDPINLEKTYDVKIHTTGNLANSKAARTQMMISIKREFPEIISNELFLDVLGISHAKKFMNVITASVSSAEAENQDMMNGIPVAPPARYEDLITHWETHMIPMQTLDFKSSPEEVKNLFIEHMAATEKLMFEVRAENPLFGARLDQLKQFPIFYTPVPVNEIPFLPEGIPGESESPIEPLPREVA